MLFHCHISLARSPSPSTSGAFQSTNDLTIIRRAGGRRSADRKKGRDRQPAGNRIGGQRARRRNRPAVQVPAAIEQGARSEEHTSELQSLMRISYAVFCLKKKKKHNNKKNR